MIDILCISTFDLKGKVKNTTLNKVYKTKFIVDNKVLIINDRERPQLVDRINFVIYSNMKKII
jgi:hypothetical protein